MQTFLPYANFLASAQCLDGRRLGKQRVECKQILIALGISVGDNPGNTQSSWRSHPAVRMWRGHEAYLCEYAAIVCHVWRKRGYGDGLLPQFIEARQEILGDRKWHQGPAWLGMEEFHASHRSNLLRKMPQFYGQYGWAEPNDLPYFWPVAEASHSM